MPDNAEKVANLCLSTARSPRLTRSSRLGLVIVGLVGSAIGCVACDNSEKECGALSATLKSGSVAPEHPETSASLVKDVGQAASVYKSYGETLRKQMADLDKLQFGDPKLTRYAGEYKQVAGELAEKANQAGSAFEALVQPRKKLAEQEANWSKSYDGVVNACNVPKSRPKQCLAIERLGRGPDGSGETTLADDLDKFAASLEKFEIEEAPLKSAISARSAAIRAYAGQIRAVSAAEALADSAGGAFTNTAKTREAVVRKIEKQCTTKD